MKIKQPFILTYKYHSEEEYSLNFNVKYSLRKISTMTLDVSRRCDVCINMQQGNVKLYDLFPNEVGVKHIFKGKYISCILHCVTTEIKSMNFVMQYREEDAVYMSQC